MVRKLLLTVLLFLCSILMLFGALSATYTPQPYLAFKLGNEVSTPNTPAGSFSSNRLVAHLGTIVITATEGSPIIHPRMVNYNGSNHLWLAGPMPAWGPGDQISQFNVWAKTSFITQPFELWLGSSEMSLNGGSQEVITQNPFIVDLFLGSHQPSSLYVKDAIYTISSGSFGSFNIKVLESKKPWKEAYVPVNNQTMPPGGGPPATPIPIPEGGPGAPIPEIPYGDIPETTPVSYGLTIIEDGSFDLDQACGYNQSVQVATAHMTVSHGEANKKYKVDIIFRNVENSPTFTLKGEDSNHGYEIPYALMFGGEPVTGGDVNEWYTLDNGANQRTIAVTGINRNTADGAPADNYKDTIYVEVIPVE